MPAASVPTPTENNATPAAAATPPQGPGDHAAFTRHLLDEEGLVVVPGLDVEGPVVAAQLGDRDQKRASPIAKDDRVHGPAWSTGPGQRWVRPSGANTLTSKPYLGSRVKNCRWLAEIATPGRGGAKVVSAGGGAADPPPSPRSRAAARSIDFARPSTSQPPFSVVACSVVERSRS
jgi:hypothetical protein